MEYGSTPSDIRKKNQLLVLNSLRDNAATYIQLASKLNLSTTAINNIICELVSKNIINYIGLRQTNQVGRKSTLVDLNDKYGIIILISLASSPKNDIFTVYACDLKNNELARITIPSIIGDTAELNRYMKQSIDELLVSLSPTHGKLLTICIAAPGMVDDETGSLIATCLKKDDEGYNIKEFLELTYSIKVHVRSLMSCVAKAELKKGALVKGCKFGIVFNISAGTGISFVINNSPFTGAHGYAGEIGLIKTDLTQGGNSSLKQRLSDSIDKDISLSHMLERIRYRMALLGHDVSDFSFDKMFDEYNNNSDIVLEEVLINAHKVSAILKNLIILLDLDNVVLCGNVINFGDRYLNILNSALEDTKQYNVKICFSTLSNPHFDGIIDTAIKVVFDKMIS